MTNEQSDFRDEQLNVSLTSAQVLAAVRFLESSGFQSTTHALRAIVAAMCSEHDAIAAATVLEAAIDGIADAEAESA